jgi:2-dehydropantoate 2-reductase
LIRSRHIKEILWSKLLMNLNNSINALAGVPLVEELSQRGYRKVLAASMREGLTALKRAGITSARLVKISPSWMPFMLSLPDWMFTRLAGAMLNIDPTARSSMWEDLERHRQTEIDYLNGEIVMLAEAYDLDAPVNRKIIALVKEAEKAGGGSPKMSAEQLLAAAL